MNKLLLKLVPSRYYAGWIFAAAAMYTSLFIAAMLRSDAVERTWYDAYLQMYSASYAMTDVIDNGYVRVIWIALSIAVASILVGLTFGWFIRQIFRDIRRMRADRM